MSNGSATTQTVTIDVIQGIISVAPDIVHVSRGAGDDVEWTSTYPFTVEFKPGSPFSSATFPPAPGNAAASGPVRPNAAKGRYKYKVKITGYRDLDPGVHVDP